MKDPRFAKFVVAVNALVPLALLSWDGYQHDLGADPEKFALHTTGMLALIFLSLSLAVTPVRKITGYNFLSHFRRLLGLYAFFYGCLHFLIYVTWDQSMHVGRAFYEIVHRPYLLVGSSALLMMVPLAATSTNGMIKRLGAKRWKQLHWLAYPAAIAGVIHYWMEGKVVTALPISFAIAITILLGYRIAEKQFAFLRKRPGGPQRSGSTAAT